MIVDGTAHDLGSAGHWAPTTIPEKDGACTLSRIVNPSAASVAKLAGGKALSLREAQELDTVKMPGEYATVIECTGSGGAPVRVSTWNWKEAHMPTDYLMNTRIELPEEDAAGAGLSAGKALSECKDATVRALWPEALLADLKATCGNHVKSCPAGTKEPAATEEPTTAPPTTTEVTTTEAPPATKPEYTTFNKGAACEGNGAVSIKTLADCSAAPRSASPTKRRWTTARTASPTIRPTATSRAGRLKFNSAGTWNTGDCTDKDVRLLGEAPNACCRLGQGRVQSMKGGLQVDEGHEDVHRRRRRRRGRRQGPVAAAAAEPAAAKPWPPIAAADVAAGDKPEYTTFNAGASCEANGAKPDQDARRLLGGRRRSGLSDTPAVDDGQDGVSYDPSRLATSRTGRSRRL